MSVPVSALHIPVLADRCIELLLVGITAVTRQQQSTNPDQARSFKPVVIDGTLGMGGHAQKLLQAERTVKLIGIDRDAQAIKLASRRLSAFQDRFTTCQTTYDQIPQVLAELHPGPLAGILLDLGVSSLQLDDDQRGFSYARDTALDMRMDQSTGQTAADLLAKFSAEELSRIFRIYGEERFAAKIAKRIVETRSHTPIVSSAQLVELIRQAIPAAARRQGGNPAKRCFQALRIAVNRELEILQNTIPSALSALAPGGVLVVESYQSLEDKIVKQLFRQATSVKVPAGVPLRDQELHSPFKDLTRGAIKATAEEIAQNSRSASVRLRAVQKSEPFQSGYSAASPSKISGRKKTATFPQTLSDAKYLDQKENLVSALADGLEKIPNHPVSKGGLNV